MVKNSSSKDLDLLKIDRFPIEIKNSTNFKYSKVQNCKSGKIAFYTFHSGFKKINKDLLFLVFKEPVSVASVYSKTSTPSAPIIWDKKTNKGMCKVLIINSGNANAHTGAKGLKAISQYATIASKKFSCSLDQVLVSSTGVIGEQLDSNKIIKKLNLINKAKSSDLLSAAKAIMTTDTYPKTIIKKIKINDHIIKVFGFAKGSGMIAPNMGTMLAYIFIEADLSKNFLKKLLDLHIETSFNSITVDGDTSTSDTMMIFSIGNNHKNFIINKKNLNKLSSLVKIVMENLAKQIVLDGEGISKLIEINVIKAKNYKQASLVAFSVANSLLVKTAVSGQDANWGRIIAAIGKSDQYINQNKIKLSFGKLIVSKNGEMFKKIDLKKLDKYMKNKMIEINIDLSIGRSSRTVYSSDLTHDYVRINSDYRS